MEIKQSFRFYHYRDEEAFLNEQLKRNYVLHFVEQNTYHFKPKKVDPNAFYRIAFYSEKQDTEYLKRAFNAEDVLEAELENMGGYYYYLLLTDAISLKDDRESALIVMKQRLEGFNLMILLLLIVYFAYKYWQERQWMYLIFLLLNAGMIFILLQQIKKIKKGLQDID